MVSFKTLLESEEIEGDDSEAENVEKTATCTQCRKASRIAINPETCFKHKAFETRENEPEGSVEDGRTFFTAA